MTNLLLVSLYKCVCFANIPNLLFSCGHWSTVGSRLSYSKTLRMQLGTEEIKSTSFYWNVENATRYCTTFGIVGYMATNQSASRIYL